METESQQQVEHETTGVSESQVSEQPTENLLSQEEVNRIVAERVERERKKFERKYADIDVDRYQQLTEAEEARRVEEQKKRGEFEEILKSTVGKKDSVIENLQKELHNIKVDGAMLNIASKHKAINPEQVVSLVKNQVRMSETGEVEVVDPQTGTIRYNDSGDPLSMDELVEDFLQNNPHFVTATPRGSGTTSNTRDSSVKKLDVTQLDMKNPEHKRMYAEYRKNTLNIR